MWTFNEAQQLEKRQKLLDVLNKQFVTALWQKLILYFGPWMYVEALPMQFSNWPNACNKDSKQSRIYGFCDKLSGFWSLCLKSLEIKTRFSRKHFDKNIFSEKQKIGISSNLVSNIENIWEFASLPKIEAEPFFLFPGLNWLHHEQIWRILLRTWLFCHRLLF